MFSRDGKVFKKFRFFIAICLFFGLNLLFTMGQADCGGCPGMGGETDLAAGGRKKCKMRGSKTECPPCQMCGSNLECNVCSAFKHPLLDCKYVCQTGTCEAVCRVRPIP